MHFLIRKTALLIALLSVLSTGALAANAAMEPPVLAKELSLPVGSVFEIYADHDIADPTYNWSLLLDNTFLQSGRNPWFRARLIQPGNYLFTGEILNADNSKYYKQVIIIRVKDEESTQVLADNSGAIVKAIPNIDQNNRIVLPSGNGIVQLTPVTSSSEGLVLDMNKTVDVNKDGNSKNDQMVNDTFFSEQHTPLHIWFATPIERRVITVSLRGRIETEQEISIMSPEQARKEDAELLIAKQKEEDERARILVSNFGSGTVKFSTYLENEEYSNNPILLHWNFGDGKQSLLDAPIHTYTSNKTYDVRVNIRNLRTGEDFTQLTESVVIKGLPIVPSDTGGEQVPNQGGTEGTSEGESKSSGSGLIFTIFKYGFGILIAIAIGFFLTLLIRFLKKQGGVSSMLDQAEANLTKNDDHEDGTDAIAPMAISSTEEEVPADIMEEKAPSIIDTTFETETVSHEDFQKEPEPDLSSTDTETPAWLQKGMSQESEPLKPEPTPPATEEPFPPSSEDNDVVPPWLQSSPSESTPPSEKPAEPVIPETPSVPEPAPEPPPTEEVPEPTPPSAPAEEPVKTETPMANMPPSDTNNAPDWLQQGMQKAAQEGQTPKSPPPPELQDTPPAQVPVQTEEPPAPAPAAANTETNGEHHIPPEQWATMTPEEREQELRRQKRRRYRQNKKARAKTENVEKEPEETKEQVQEPIQTEESQPVEQPEPDQNKEEAIPKPSPIEEHEIPKQEDAIGEPIPLEENDNDVKFVIGADSISPAQ